LESIIQSAAISREIRDAEPVTAPMLDTLQARMQELDKASEDLRVSMETLRSRLASMHRR
jgi:hypothetical protein